MKFKQRLARQMVLIAFISFGLSGAVYGDVVWDESVDGDLSGDPLAPTSVVFGLDSNELIGSVQSPNDTRDFFTFTIPQNRLLTGIFLLEYEDLDNGGDGNRGFIHLDDGTTSVIPGPATIGSVLGANHVDRITYPNSLVNVLSDLSTAPLGGSGFDTPLGPGDYTFNIQQTGPPLTGYRLDFVVGVPEPASTSVVFMALTTMFFRRRK